MGLKVENKARVRFHENKVEGAWKLSLGLRGGPQNIITRMSTKYLGLKDKTFLTFNHFFVSSI